MQRFSFNLQEMLEKQKEAKQQATKVVAKDAPSPEVPSPASVAAGRAAATAAAAALASAPLVPDVPPVNQEHLQTVRMLENDRLSHIGLL